jgi:hypothetical protein
MIDKKKKRRRRRLGFWWCCCGFWLFGLIIAGTIPAVLFVNNTPRAVILNTTGVSTTTTSTTLIPTTGTTTTTITTTTSPPPTTSPFFNNKVYVTYDKNPSRNFNPTDRYFLGNWTQLGLMDIDTGVIQHIAEITFIHGLTSPFRWYTHTIIMGPDNNLYGIAEVVITAANPQNYFVKVNTTNGSTQLICGNVGFLFGYATDALLITKDGVVYFK